MIHAGEIGHYYYYLFIVFFCSHQHKACRLEIEYKLKLNDCNGLQVDIVVKYMENDKALPLWIAMEIL